MKSIFRKAHQMTREIVEKYEVDYNAQFSLCLKFLYEEDNEISTKEDLKEILIEVMEEENEKKLEEIMHYSCNKWIKYGKKRVYVELYFRYRGGLVGNFKTYIDYTNEDKKFIANLSGTGSHIYNDMVKASYHVVRENVNEIIKIAS